MMTRQLNEGNGIASTAAISGGRSKRRALTLLYAIVSMATMTTALLSTGSAYAGNWMEVSCENPNLSAAPSEGWSSFAAGGGYGSNNSTSCGPGNPMFAILSTQAAVGVGAAETLQYTPPSGSTLIGGSIDAALNADGGGFNASGTAVIYTPNYAYDGSDVVLQCASGLPPCANGTYDYAGVVPIPGSRGGDLYLSAGCGGAPGYSCNTGGSEGAWSLVRMWWANLLLSNSATPGASGIGGTLLSPRARGVQDLAFTATDTGGPGVYTVTAQIDGKAVYSGTPDSNGGKCIAVGTSGGTLMFDYSQPCRASESVDLPINTASVADGQHTLKVTVEDAARNSSVVDVATITTKNAPAASSPPTILAPSQLFVGHELQSHPGTWSAPAGTGTVAYGYQWESCDAQGNNCNAISGAQSATYTPTAADVGHTLRLTVNASDSDGLTAATSAPTNVVLSAQGTLGAPNGPGTGPGTVGQGTPNGSGASESATIRLGVRRAFTRPFARRAFKLNGRLLDAQGHPIAAASLDISQQIVEGGTMRIIAHATTRADGTFTVRLPASASRLINVAYRAFSGDTSYAAEAKTTELVGAGSKLEIAPSQTSPNGTIILTGRVLGHIPRQGIVVELLVYYRGHWEPVRYPRTDSSGHFQAVYQFQGAVGWFPFRAEVLGGQASFPYSNGYSKKIYVKTG